eukprot:gnl/MRDRNA2_/MRDRNA2_63874_c0_seq3.p1 gnl/MRDRNA2_/MRDRNA2_63874_c0~~gnl/MRDRNA2_/MRDRNA2_63874_c0_seq3.p1  ORF type:complete len:220 (-),score=41.51 gnl/MRDRNA2_/MRDRNA2_63874_c0_seq3:58-717(-)
MLAEEENRGASTELQTTDAMQDKNGGHAATKSSSTSIELQTADAMQGQVGYAAMERLSSSIEMQTADATQDVAVQDVATYYARQYNSTRLGQGDGGGESAGAAEDEVRDSLSHSVSVVGGSVRRKKIGEEPTLAELLVAVQTLQKKVASEEDLKNLKAELLAETKLLVQQEASGEAASDYNTEPSASYVRSGPFHVTAEIVDIDSVSDPPRTFACWKRL